MDVTGGLRRITAVDHEVIVAVDDAVEVGVAEIAGTSRGFRLLRSTTVCPFHRPVYAAGETEDIVTRLATPSVVRALEPLASLVLEIIWEPQLAFRRWRPDCTSVNGHRVAVAAACGARGGRAVVEVEGIVGEIELSADRERAGEQGVASAHSRVWPCR